MIINFSTVVVTKPGPHSGQDEYYIETDCCVWGVYLHVTGSLVGLISYFLLDASQLLLQVSGLVLMQLGQVVQLILQPLTPTGGDTQTRGVCEYV